MQSHHLYAAGNQSAAAYQNAAAAGGYTSPANMTVQAPAGPHYNQLVMMPVNHPGMPQPGHAPAYTGYPGRDGGPPVMYGGQPGPIMLTAQPMQQGQRTGTVPQVFMQITPTPVYPQHVQQQSVQYGGQQSSWQPSQQPAAHPSSQQFNPGAVHSYQQGPSGGQPQQTHYLTSKSNTEQRHNPANMYSYGVSGVSSGPPMMTQPMQHPQHQQPTASSSEHHHPHRPPHPPPQQPRRPKHMLEIIDPNTGKNVLFGGAEQTAVTDHPPAAAAAAAATATLTATSATVINAESHRASPTNQVAAEFAAKVAAILYPPSATVPPTSLGPDETTSLAGGSDADVVITETGLTAGPDDVPQHPPGKGKGKGKDGKRKRNKKKDVNTKTRAGHGTDMDVFIDDAQFSTPPVTSAASEITSASSAAEAAEEVPVDESSSAVTAELKLADGEVDDDDKDTPGSQDDGDDDGRHGDALTQDLQPAAASADDTPQQSVAMLTEDNTVLPSDDNQTTSTAAAADSVISEDKTLADDVVVTEMSDVIDMEPTEDDDDVADETSQTSVKPDLKYQYSEDQWSPLNPEGKKQYDRNFMLKLQFVQSSVTRPANLPALPDIILNEPPHMRVGVADGLRHHSMEALGRSAAGHFPPDFTPGFIKSSPSGGRRPQRIDRSMSSMKKDTPGGPGLAGRHKIIQVSLQQDVKLHTSDNAWKLKKETTQDDDDAATQDLYKKVRGILNKLTPQKFKTLVQQVLDLTIDTEKRLKGCIDIIFEKAISEPNFSVAYANMAKCMLNLNVPKEADASHTVNFRNLLLNKCQQEFEKDKVEELDIAEKQKLIDEATSDEQKRQLTIELDQIVSKAKRRSLGNIRFIGELYKLRMLTETIMHDCLFKLIRSCCDEDNLECLCQLLMTIGQELDNKQSKLQPRMERYFNQLVALVEERKTSSRIRFLLLDTIDLRKNQWVPRREKNNPKTIEQIHREAQEEVQQKQAAIQRASIEQRNTALPARRPAGQPPARTGVPVAGGVGDDGWTAVSRPPKSNIVDPSRLKLTKREQVDESAIQLGPGGRGMGCWHRGSSGGGKQSVASPDLDLRQPNRYSALSSAAVLDISESRNRSLGRSAGAGGGSREYVGRMSSGSARSSLTPRSSQEKNFDTPVMTAAARVTPVSSQGASAAEPVTQRPTPATDEAARQRDVPEMPEDELRRKTKSIVDEYLHLNDLKEVSACMTELLKSSSGRVSMSLFVNECLLLTVERTSTARHHTGKMLHHLIRTHVLTLSDYIAGLHEFLGLADDMVIDVPRIWQYIAELISPLLLDEHSEIPLDFLRKACAPLLACEGGDKAALVISMVLLDAVHSLGHHTVADMWQKSGLQWSEFLSDPDKVDEFLAKNKVEFTVRLRPVAVKSADELSASGAPSGSDSQYSELSRLLNDSEVDNELIIDWIDENVSEVNGDFIRALITAAYTPALTVVEDGCTVQQDVVKLRSALLQKYIHRDISFELEALYAVQLIVHRHGHPYGTLRALFDVLYDDELVSEESFLRWRDKNQEGEQTGRGVAILSVDQFYKWLEEDTTS